MRPEQDGFARAGNTSIRIRYEAAGRELLRYGRFSIEAAEGFRLYRHAGEWMLTPPAAAIRADRGIEVG